MVVHCLYVYDRLGNCLYYAEWMRPRKANTAVEDQKLMYGMYYSLRAFCKGISPYPGCQGFSSYTTGSYKLHFYETASGFKFILMTDTTCGDLRDVLHGYYASVLVDGIVLAPQYEAHQQLQSNSNFVQRTDQFFRSLPIFK